MKTWIVETHLGAFETTAESAEKAISNIRFRMFGRRRFCADLGREKKSKLFSFCHL